MRPNWTRPKSSAEDWRERNTPRPTRHRTPGDAIAAKLRQLRATGPRNLGQQQTEAGHLAWVPGEGKAKRHWQRLAIAER